MSTDVSDDIRLMGRLIGDVLREQAGQPAFELVERVRQIAVAERRDGKEPIDALTAELGTADLEAQLHLIRAFGLLSVLANTAEDLHQERRRRYHRDAGSGLQDGSLAATFEHLLANGVAADVIAAQVGELLVSPVITAHPTEVRRRTVLDHVDAVGELLARRALAAGSPSEEADVDAALRLEILMLWQTAEVRLSKLRVRDEINEALRYYQSSIFETIPALLADLDALALDRVGTMADNPRAISMGSWIGGDRDGNPFVTADVLRLAVDSQAATALGHHLLALHALALQLSMSARLITPTPALAELADASADESPFRADEPYRRALRGMHARLWSLAAKVLDYVPGPAPHASLPPYTSPDELIADLGVVADSLASHGAGELAATRVVPLRRGVGVFRTHLCGLDLRQNSEIHEQVVAELLRVAGVTDRYEQLDEAHRVEVLTAELSGGRPLVTPFVTYSDAVQSELAVVREAAAAHARFGAEIIPHAIISKAESVSDVLEQAVLLKEAGLVRVDPATGEIASAVDIVPLFETISDLRHADETLAAMLGNARYRQIVASRGEDRKSTRLNSSHWITSRMPSSA